MADATTNPVTTPAPAEGTESTLSDWAGDYVTSMLGQAEALGPPVYDAAGNLVSGRPYQEYGADQAKYYGDIAKNFVAGPSQTQTDLFAGIGALTAPATYSTPGATMVDPYTEETYTPTTFNLANLQQYMNPYLQAVLDPQIRDAQRNAEIARNKMQSRMAKAGAYGGSRQAIMESEGQRNLQNLLSDITGKGYYDAYETGAKRFDEAAKREFDAAKFKQEESQFGAKYALDSAKAREDAAAAERRYGLDMLDTQMKAAEAERLLRQKEKDVAYEQFLREERSPYEQIKFMKEIIQGIPGISALINQREGQDPFEAFLGGAKNIAGLITLLQNYLKDNPSSG